MKMSIVGVRGKADQSFCVLWSLKNLVEMSELEKVQDKFKSDIVILITSIIVRDFLKELDHYSMERRTKVSEA